MTPDNLLNEIRSIPYCVYRLIEINEELDVKNHEILGLSHHQEQVPTHLAYNKHGNPKFNAYGEIKRELDHPEWQELPMPSYHGQGATSPLGMLAEISRLEEEANHYRKRILDCRWLELLGLTDQNMIMDLYVFKMRPNVVARRYGWSKGGMYKYIKRTIRDVIIGPEDTRPGS